MLTADQIITLLNLKPHPEEGGYFVDDCSTETLSRELLPNRYKGDRSFSTAIYYLLTPGTFSTTHQLRSDEVFHFYLGNPVEMIQLWPDGSIRVLILGSDILNGMQPQVVVPRGVWQGAKLLKMEDLLY